MKPLLLLPLALLGTALCVSCKPAAETADRPVGRTNDTTNATTAAQPGGTATLGDELRDFSYEQRADYVAALRAQVAEMNRRLETLERSYDRPTSGDADAVRPKTTALRERVAQLERQIQSLEAATPDTWDRIKAETRQAYGDAKESFNDARQWASEKIAP